MYSHYENLAGQLAASIPSAYSPIEIIACSADRAAKLAGDKAVSLSYWREAIAEFLKNLPEDFDAAELQVKTTASKVLGDSNILELYTRRRDAVAKLAAVENDLRNIEIEKAWRLNRICNLTAEIESASASLQIWDRPWDALLADSESKILGLYGDASPGAGYNMNQIQASFEDIARITVLRKLAPAAIAKLNATLASASAELEQLRPKVTQAPEPVAPLVRGRQAIQQPALA